MANGPNNCFLWSYGVLTIIYAKIQTKTEKIILGVFAVFKGFRSTVRRPLCPFGLYKPVFNGHTTSVKTHKNQSFSSHRPSNGKKSCFS